jgi:hypothetical protein
MSKGEEIMLKATVVREWAEVKRNGFKVEDWSWTVTFFKDDVRIDEHYYKSAPIASTAAAMFRRGEFITSEFGGVQF